MAAKADLQHSIFVILKNNRDGSYATKADRQRILYQFAKDLVGLNYKLRNIYHLKPKHIEVVINHWKEKKLSNATLKNRVAVLRYLTTKINKPNIIPSNDNLAIGKRQYVSKQNRALHHPDFEKITNTYIRVSLELQRVFGLRREEALKIKPWQADRGEHLHLNASWCKGGRSRIIPILTKEQQHWLEEAKRLVVQKNASLIPKNKSYIQQRYLYDKQTLRAGLKNLHGLRHAYAQRRYKELTGWECPINGGLSSKQLTSAQKTKDYEARMIITEELGHSREQILSSYCGR